MSFLFPGQSPCGLCEAPIVQRTDAARLEQVGPADAGGLWVLSGRYVHRRCWRDWEHRGEFAAAAETLRRRAADEDGSSLVADVDGAFLYARSDRFSIEDVHVPIVLPISRSEQSTVPAWLLGLFGRPAHAEERLTSGGRGLAATWSGDELTLTLHLRGDPKWRFVLGPARRVAWAPLLSRMDRCTLP